MSDKEEVRRSLQAFKGYVTRCGKNLDRCQAAVDADPSELAVRQLELAYEKFSRYVDTVEGGYARLQVLDWSNLDTYENKMAALLDERLPGGRGGRGGRSGCGSAHAGHVHAGHAHTSHTHATASGHAQDGVMPLKNSVSSMPLVHNLMAVRQFVHLNALVGSNQAAVEATFQALAGSQAVVKVEATFQVLAGCQAAVAVGAVSADAVIGTALEEVLADLDQAAVAVSAASMVATGTM